MPQNIAKFLFLSLFLTFNLCISAQAQTPKDKFSDSPFGVLEFLNWNHGWNNHNFANDESLIKAIALMKEAGVSWLRMDFSWEDIEPQKGKFNFDKYDHIVELVSKAGIKILGLLSYSASWAGESWNSPPYKNEDFADYAAAVVGHFKGKVDYWEIWNEPDQKVYFSPQDEMVRYTEILKASDVSAKKANPD